MRVCLARSSPFGAFLSSWQEYPTMRAFATGDLTRWKGDAIVNAANPAMLGGGGVDGAIHRAAGPELQDACYEVEEVQPGIRCLPGEARVTPGFRLEARFVVHTVGPVYKNGRESAPILRNAFKNSLLQCKKNGLKSVAFPAISCGIYGYPVRKAAEVGIATILEFSEGLDHIEFVLFGKDTYEPFLAEANRTLERVEGKDEGRDGTRDSGSRKREQDSDSDGKGDEMLVSSQEKEGEEVDAEFSQETLVDDGMKDKEEKEKQRKKEDEADEEAQEEVPKRGKVEIGEPLTLESESAKSSRKTT